MEPNFNTFLNNVLLTDNQKEDAKTKIKSVCEVVHAKYYPTLAYDGSTKLLIGSYGKHTNIRPPKDIDIIFRMPESEFTRLDGLSGNKQSQLLQEVRGLLTDKFTTTEEIRAFGKVIVINFSEGTHIVELLPAWQLPSGAYKIPNTENGGSWDTWDPLVEFRNIDESQKATQCTRPLIRMLKAWVRNCGVPLKSFILEILVVDYLKQKFNSQVSVGYPELALGFFEYMKIKKNSSVLSLATGTSISLGEEWFSRADSASSRAEKAIAYAEDEKMRDASLEWQKIFGDDFPLSEDVSKTFADPLETKIIELTKTYPSAKEEYVTDYGISVALTNRHRVVIDAEVTQDGFRTALLSAFVQKRYPLKKGKKLKFRITDINVPSPYSVMWKVRNFGDDAQRADGLRGEITHDYGAHMKEEHTLYHGEHYVECYVIKESICVAIGRILVPIGTNYE